ncbi:NACHT C-terminal helical domain 2-containing protein [Candidatus Leptofilum sp.]|uniref:NACHT C-terminal helical domain 2-containing protein n=1 Tax=Candidatus Leptofilum sp. TaxID=3241576 RepID=UPI003B5B6183
MKVLALPDESTPIQVKREFDKKLASILGQYRDQWDPFRLLAVKRDEGFPLKCFSEEQMEAWADYLQANLLLVRCLQVAYVPNRQALEDKILLPPDMW